MALSVPSARRRRGVRRAALAACCAVVVLSACTATGTEGSRGDAPPAKSSDPPLELGPPPSIAAVPQLTDMRGQRLPVEAYLLQPAQSAKIQAARRALVVRCMKGQGIDFAFPTTPGSGSGTGTGTGLPTQSEQRYVTPPEVAAEHGYHSPDRLAPRPPQPNLPKKTEEALVGADGTGGCFAAVDADFAARGLVVQDSELVVGINIDNMARSMEDERMKAAFGRWSGCMKAKGYTYATPMEASGDPRWAQAPAPSPEETATALAHTACMTENNLVGTWFTIESAYEQRDIDAHAAELAAYRTAVENTLRFADSVLAQG